MIEHTADTGIRVTARCKEQLFADAAHGMFAVIGSVPEGLVATHSISLSADSPEGLIVDWLSRLLHLFETRNFFFTSTSQIYLIDDSIEATVEGVQFSRIDEATEIKAVTYHMLEIIRDGHQLSTTVYFDL